MFQLIFDTSSPPLARTTALSDPYLLIGLGIFLILAAFYVFHRMVRALRRPDMHGMTREHVTKMWKEIADTSDNGLMGAKLAVIEADKLLDNVFKSLMMPGETMGERLKSAGYKYPRIGQVWSAHRLRNQLVHDTTFEISVRQAKEALRDFREALRTLNVME